MNDKKAIAQFMRFMKQKRAWAAFKINLKDKSLQDGMMPRPCKTHGVVNVPFYLKECPPMLYVMFSFTWLNSPQGFEYWTKMNKDWADKKLNHNN